ncbi:hypothetical protein [Streptomyces sp. NPDC058678]|uniref:hypothetical protein n=1 Tax=Streptomyces sp. NPDC058678 TaxID=3346595 RepID=UPI0036669821
MTTDAVKAATTTAVAKMIATAATDNQPRPRRTAGPLASRVTIARRLVPAGTFDKQIRENNRLPACPPAVRGDRLYITDGGVPEPHDPKLQTARINFPALLAGATH